MTKNDFFAALKNATRNGFGVEIRVFVGDYEHVPFPGFRGADKWFHGDGRPKAEAEIVASLLSIRDVVFLFSVPGAIRTRSAEKWMDEKYNIYEE